MTRSNTFSVDLQNRRVYGGFNLSEIGRLSEGFGFVVVKRQGEQYLIMSSRPHATRPIVRVGENRFTFEVTGDSKEYFLNNLRPGCYRAEWKAEELGWRLSWARDIKRSSKNIESGDVKEPKGTVITVLVEAPGSGTTEFEFPSERFLEVIRALTKIEVDKT